MSLLPRNDGLALDSSAVYRLCQHSFIWFVNHSQSLRDCLADLPFFQHDFDMMLFLGGNVQLYQKENLQLMLFPGGNDMPAL